MLLIGGAVLLIILAIIGFVIFSKNKSGKSTSGDQIELVYWGLWEPDAHMQEVIDEYESQHPNITIKYEQKRITQYEDNLYERLGNTEITTPDIVRINNTWTYKFEDRLASLPSEVMTASEYQQAFYPTAKDDFTGSDGNIYAIPLEIDGLAMYYNKDIFEKAGITEPPKDWDTLIEVAKELTLTDYSGNITQAGAALGCSNNINHSADIMFALMLQNNVTMTNSDYSEATFNNTRGQTALKVYTDYVNEHEVWSCSLPNDLNMFIEGKLAIMFAPSWRVFDIFNMNSAVNFEVAELPQIAGSDVDINYSMYWGDAVSIQSENQLEAWKFIEFLSEKEQLESMYAAASKNRTFGEPYSRIDMASSISNDPYVGAFIRMAPTMESWKMVDQSTAEAAINKAISDVVDGRSNENAALMEATETINEKNAQIRGTTQ